jgi:hypothetical protein
MKHRVRTHRWHAGRLRVHEEEFDSLEEAQLFASTRFGAESIKIYNEIGEIIDNLTPVTVSDNYATYA